MKRVKIVGVFLFIIVCAAGCNTTETNIPNVTEQVVLDSAKDVTADTKNIAEQYREIYESAYENKSLGSLEVTRKIVSKLGKCGYSAVDMENQIDMVNADKVEKFCKNVEKKREAELTILLIANHGGFSRFDFHTREGSVEIKSCYLTWKGLQTQVNNAENFTACTWKYTDYGYLIFEEYHPPGYDGASGHTAIRVKSLDETCREYNRKYIIPIGYGYNNMFATEWNESDFGDLNFYDLYEMWYQEKYRHPVTTDLNMDGKTYEIQEKEFENVIASHIRIDSEVLQSKTVFFPSRNTYRYCPRGLYDCYVPTYPEPEVIDYQINDDGTIKLTVNAVWEWENNDTAFLHEVVVRPMEDGGTQYVSNHILESDKYVEPSWYMQRLTDKEWDKLYGEKNY